MSAVSTPLSERVSPFSLNVEEEEIGLELFFFLSRPRFSRGDIINESIRWRFLSTVAHIINKIMGALMLLVAALSSALPRTEMIHLSLIACLIEARCEVKTLYRLIPSKHCFSFFLKSATDRWPLVYLFEIVALLFDRSFASSVVNSTLATNSFIIPFVRGISFVAGQPLGDYGSWPLFAFSHHLLVWWSAERVYPGLRFDRYAVLGDDVLITDPEVAQVYQGALKRLGVTISYHKSLVSSSGAAEFAKRFLIRDMRVDLSPISMKALLGFHHPFGLIALKEKSNLSYSLLMRDCFPIP